MTPSFLSSHRQYPILLLVLLVLTACESSSHTVSKTPTHEEKALEVAKRDLPNQGKLEQGPDGFVYLKVTNQYVDRLFPLVQEPGFDIPNSIKRHTKIGAHISVFFKREAQSLGPIHEIGNVYSFEPERVRVVRAGRKEYIILEVKSPDLERLRKQYGLSPKLINHEFHITLGEKNLHRH